MLVIRRKVSESILIGDDIEIKVVTLENGTVQIGIEAPREVNIVRKEIVKEVEKENREALEVDLKLLKNIKIK